MKREYIYIGIIVILFLLYITKKTNKKDDGYDAYGKLRDSTVKVIHEKEIIREKTQINITNILNQSTNEKIQYTMSDSNRIAFIDSFLRAKGLR